MQKIRKIDFNGIAIVLLLTLTIGSFTIASGYSQSPVSENDQLYQTIKSATAGDPIAKESWQLIDSLKKIRPEHFNSTQKTEVAIKTLGQQKNDKLTVSIPNSWNKFEGDSDNLFVANDYLFAEFGSYPAVENGRNLTVEQVANQSVKDNNATVVDQFEKNIGNRKFLVTVMDLKNENSYVVIYNKILNTNTPEATTFHAQVFFSKQVTNADQKNVLQMIANLEQSLSEINWY